MIDKSICTPLKGLTLPNCNYYVRIIVDFAKGHGERIVVWQKERNVRDQTCSAAILVLLSHQVATYIDVVRTFSSDGVQ